MNTPSHFLINAALAKRAGQSVARSAFLWGSLGPDIPLYLLSIVGGLYLTGVQGMPAGEAADYMFNDLFFNNKSWIIAQNTLQAPLVLLAAITLLWPLRLRPLYRWLFWFFVGCALHVVLDILVHHNDGPLLLFPFNWQLRFESPVSYWDPNHYGDIFIWFELGLDALLLAYLLIPWLKQRQQKRKGQL